MTDTERDDVLKKRQSRIEDVKVGISNIPDNIIGNIRSFEITAKVTIHLLEHKNLLLVKNPQFFSYLHETW